MIEYISNSNLKRICFNFEKYKLYLFVEVAELLYDFYIFLLTKLKNPKT
jgi:hypothetical protein